MAEVRSCLRYNVARRTATVLEVVCIEEENYAPRRWQSVRYQMNTEELDPEIHDLCLRAQLLAFCRSYLARFPD